MRAHRPSVMSRKGVVSSGHNLASMIGAQILAKGGNAFDAAVATSAALTVIRPHMCSPAGDAFALLYPQEEGRVLALNASGPAPREASISFFKDKGYDAIPEEGFLSSTVPGIVEAWDSLQKRYCTLQLKELLEPAATLAEEGFPAYPNLIEHIEEGLRSGRLHEDTLDIFAPKGRAPRVGELVRQPSLAEALRVIGEEGSGAFYEGRIGEAITRYLKEHGGLLSLEDLKGYRCEFKEPLMVNYRGYKVYGQPPVSQGLILMEELRLVEGFDLARMGHLSADAIHVMVEAKKLAFADRLAYLGDPAFVKVPLEELLSEEYIEVRRRAISLDAALEEVGAGELPSRPQPSTTYFCIMDEEGNGVSFIQSIFHSFGSGVTIPEVGMVMNSRMSGFTLQEGSPNALQPGKRPAHTLNTFMVFRDEEPYLIGGTPGADDQVQVNLQVICGIIDFGLELQEAIEAPRWSSRPAGNSSDEGTLELLLEGRFPPSTVEGLRRKGHRVRLVEGWSFGAFQGILVMEGGVMAGGADPRRDGYAIALP